MLHKIKKREHIQTARDLIKIFGETYVKIYGEASLTYNFHMLMYHLCDDCDNHGSLAFHSMFSVESTYGHHIDRIHGNRGQAEQFIKSIFFYSSKTILIINLSNFE